MLEPRSAAKLPVSSGRVPGKQLSTGQRGRHLIGTTLHIVLLIPLALYYELRIDFLNHGAGSLTEMENRYSMCICMISPVTLTVTILRATETKIAYQFKPYLLHSSLQHISDLFGRQFRAGRLTPGT